MLSNDPARLRFLGVDLQSRIRRRLAVVLTYAAYFVGMAALFTAFDFQQRQWLQYLCMFVWTIVMAHTGIFRSNGLVKRMEEQPNYYHDRILLRGLDDWSRYLHGGNYEVLSPDQQHDVLMRYKVGGYLLPASKRHTGFDPDAPDEREAVERNRAYTRALQFLTTLIFGVTGATVADTMRHRSLGDIPSTLMSLGFAAATLPKTIILWNEIDPRNMLRADEIPESPNG